MTSNDSTSEMRSICPADDSASIRFWRSIARLKIGLPGSEEIEVAESAGI